MAMGPRWQTLWCVCALAVSLGHAAVVPTQDTIVVARSDDATTTASAVPTTELTTEEPSLPIKLTEMDVNSEITMRYANTAIVTRVRNPGKKAQEANFRVLLPDTAFISGFVMILDGKPYKAFVKEKEEAKKIYDQAVSQGIGAAQVAAKARDSNQFTVSVNVEPYTTAVFNLTYEELLIRRSGVYNHAINLYPGALVPKLTVTVHIKEDQEITILRVPEIRTGNEIDATADDPQNPNAVIKKCKGGREATITFSPDLEEQEKLMNIYKEKSKESSSQRNNDDNKGVLGQFVVQYDVDRPQDGEILVNDGYFVHFFAPSSLPPLNKQVVFVLDTSGSMMDRKIAQLRDAMQTILSELHKGDYFSIVEFASSVAVHDLSEADEGGPPKPSVSGGWYSEPSKVTLVPPFLATPENVAKAKTIISRLTAGGGTNIAGALDVAVDLVQKGIGWTLPSNTTINQKANSESAAAPSNETPKDKQEIAEPKDNNSKDLDRIKKLEPMIIFLTDGDPTVGEVNPKRIINRVTEKNSGENRATIFSLAFGEDADRNFLRTLSLRNDGFMRYIYEAADAALQLRGFYDQVSSPLLADVKFTYPPDQIKEGSLTKYKFRTYFAGSEVIVAGRVADSTQELTPEVSGFCAVDDGYGRKLYEVFPKVAIRRREQYLPLERLWAYLTIKQLLDESDAAEASDQPQDKENGPEKQALALALKYEFVTPLTSLVVVKPNATNAVDPESAAVDRTFLAPSYSAASGAAYGLPGVAPAAYPAFSSYRTSYGGVLALQNKAYSAAYPIAHLVSGSRGYAGPSSTPAASALGLPGRPGAPGVANSVSRPAGPSVSPAPGAPAPEKSTAPAASPLTPYHLQEYQWAEPLLKPSTDSLELPVNGTTVDLKLTKDTVAPKSAAGDAECASSTEGAAGLCVYLTRCGAARNITATIYANTYCTVNDGYAGVCCPKANVDKA